jgi:hypothetical protein
VHGIPVGIECQLWVVDSSGNRVLAGGWRTDDAEGTVLYPGSTGTPTSDVSSFQVTVANQKTIKIPVPV